MSSISRESSFSDFREDLLAVIDEAEARGYVSYGGAVDRVVENIKKLFLNFQELQEENSKKKPKDRDLVAEVKLDRQIKKAQKTIDQARENFFKECYQLYQNAYHTKLSLLVLGSDLLGRGKDEEMLLNFGLLSSGDTRCPHSLAEREFEKLQGSVIGGAAWSILKNDAVILGIMHAGKTCYIAGRLDVDSFWNFEKNQPRVLLRELVELESAGYEQVATDLELGAYGPTMVCLDKDAARRATLKKIFEITHKKLTLPLFEEVSRSILSYHP